MRYLIPRVTVKDVEDEKRWLKQMFSLYEDLSEKEKDSDRDIARNILETLTDVD